MSDNPLLPHYLDQPGAPFGNYHHGTLDGTALADGGAGFVHPEIRPYVQNARVWITPCLDFVVPGHSFTAPASPPAGVNWLDHAILSGVYRNLYQIAAFPELTPLNHANKFLVSFGVGDTWACTLNPSVAVDGSGGNASVGVSLVPFGRFNEDPVTATITLSSNTLAPCGQPSFASTQDFPNTPLKLMPFDISPDGQKIILGVVDATAITTYFGYDAPRGFLLLELTKTSATLSLLKSRADMKVAVSQTYAYSETGGLADADFSCSGSPVVVSVPAWNITASASTSSSNICAAWFDTAGVVQYLKYESSSTFTQADDIGAWTTTCTVCSGGQGDSCGPVDGQTVTTSSALTHSTSVTLRRVSDSVALRTASWNGSVSMSGSSSSSGGSFTSSSSGAYSYTGTPLGGTAYSSGSIAVSLPPTVNPVPLNRPVSGLGLVRVYPDYSQIPPDTINPRPPPGTTSFSTYPKDFGDSFASEPHPVSQVGMLGLIAHEIVYQNIETFVGAVRRATYAKLPYDGSQGMVICSHPRTGQIIYKYATLGASPAPSYGFV